MIKKAKMISFLPFLPYDYIEKEREKEKKTSKCKPVKETKHQKKKPDECKPVKETGKKTIYGNNRMNKRREGNTPP